MVGLVRRFVLRVFFGNSFFFFFFLAIVFIDMFICKREFNHAFS